MEVKKHEKTQKYYPAAAPEHIGLALAYVAYGFKHSEEKQLQLKKGLGQREQNPIISRDESKEKEKVGERGENKK